MKLTRHQKNLLAAGLLFACLAGAVWLWRSLRPALPPGTAGLAAAPHEFVIAPGQGFRSIAAALKEQGIIRSAAGFQVYAVLTERSRQLKPGRYALNPADSGAAIAAQLAAGPQVDTAVTIPEGLNAAEIDALLAQAGVVKPGAFKELVDEEKLEGRLFPDTYRFYFASSPQQVLDRFLENFDKRAAPLLAADPKDAERNLILASILEKEVPQLADRKIVAGLLLKRAVEGMALQADATLCYIKAERQPGAKCYPVTAADKKIDSPYNTYLYPGLPPGAISNPGIEAIQAALEPESSPYWYYLSDPKTGDTIFAETLEEQTANRQKYLSD